MSVDLTRAKFGDLFRVRTGELMRYQRFDDSADIYGTTGQIKRHVCLKVGGDKHEWRYFDDGSYYKSQHSYADLLEKVLGEGYL